MPPRAMTGLSKCPSLANASAVPRERKRIRRQLGQWRRPLPLNRLAPRRAAVDAAGVAGAADVVASDRRRAEDVLEGAGQQARQAALETRSQPQAPPGAFRAPRFAQHRTPRLRP